MCGIVGILNKDVRREVDRRGLEAMARVIRHRGPDDSGVYVGENVGLAHQRLSIIDLESGHQPMESDDGGRVVVYNGEIYNFQSLRDELSASGMRFHTHSDTEVLLAMMTTTDCTGLNSINGMFAFALWFKSTRTLLLVRDRLGIKPLYYADLGDRFIFSSEIKSLLLHPELEREPNRELIPEFVAFRNIAGTETMFKNIYQLPPGHVMLLSPDTYTPKIVKYWDEGWGSSISDYTDAAASFQEQFTDLFTRAVESHLVSDVPVGTFNSGGVDSSLVTAIARSLRGDADLHTFSVGFEEESHDESAYAQIVADRLKTRHHRLVVTEKEYSDTLLETIWRLEEPVNHPHTTHLLHLCRIAKEFVTVVLTGEGADELFAGYPRHRIPGLAKALQLIPRPLRTQLRALRNRRLTKLMEVVDFTEDRIAINNSRFVPEADLSRIYDSELDFDKRLRIYNESIDKTDNVTQRLLYYDQRTYLNSLLGRLDKMSMAASLEARVPFLDYRLLQWSQLLPSKVKLNNFANKIVLKKSAEDWLPKSVIYRKKVGFGVPIKTWLRNPAGLGCYLELLTDTRARNRGYFDAEVVDRLVREHCSGQIDHSEILWGLLNIELWHRVFIDPAEFNAVEPPSIQAHRL